MSAANAAPRLLRPNARTVGVSVVLALLAVFVVYAAQREMRKVAHEVQPQEAHAFASQRPAQSAAEERFAQAMWNIHTEVRTAAVRMTFAGLAYKMGDADQASIRTKVAPLTDVLRQAESDLRALDTPASMRETRDRYIGAVQLYGSAAREMVMVAQDSKEAHLLQAQEMSERAAGVLLEVGDELWPGEIKPN
jgi:hypothetical protein